MIKHKRIKQNAPMIGKDVERRTVAAGKMGRMSKGIYRGKVATTFGINDLSGYIIVNEK